MPSRLILLLPYDGMFVLPSAAALILPLILFLDGENPQHQQYHQLHQFARHTSSSHTSSSIVVATEDSQYDEWNLPNGRVQFERPLSFKGLERLHDGKLRTSSGLESSSISLWNPTFLGSGGSGAVFSFSTNPNNYNSQSSSQSTNNELVAVKVSWKRSRDSVENECTILQSLEMNHVPHVEQCIGRPDNPYPYEEGRVMIALTPVVSPNDSTSSIITVEPGQSQRAAVKSAVETMIGMLQTGIYTLDVQPLMSIETGDTLFIDFTEARHFSDPPSPSEESALVGFCTEMFALIPDSLRDVAEEYLRRELEIVSDSDMPLPEKILDILESIFI